MGMREDRSRRAKDVRDRMYDRMDEELGWYEDKDKELAETKRKQEFRRQIKVPNN